MAQESGDAITVGVNEFVDDDPGPSIEIDRPIPGVMERQIERLEAVRRSRDQRRHAEALRAIEEASPTLTTNLMPLIEEAVRARASVGEISDVLRGTWGQYQPSTVF